MWLLFIFGIILGSVSAAKVPICKGISYNGIYYTSRNSRQPLYQYSYNLKVAINKNNITYPNVVTAYNFKEQLFNRSLFNRTSLFSLWFSESNGPFKECKSINETCVLSGPNAIISNYFEYTYMKKLESDLGPWLFINEGTIFDNEMGKFLDPLKCTKYDMDCGHFNLYFESNVCCTIFEYVEIPDLIEESCRKFETNAEIHDFSQNNTIRINVEYDIIGNDFNSKLKIQPVTNFTFAFYMNGGTYQDFKTRTTTEIKSQRFEIDGDFQYEMLFSYHGYSINKKIVDGEAQFEYIVVGELIRRNGILLKNNNIPYTKADPCWKKKSGIIERNATYEASFCCIKFENIATTISTTQKATTKIHKKTTTTPSLSTTTVYQTTTHIVHDSTHDIDQQRPSPGYWAWLQILFEFFRDESFWLFRFFLG